MGLSRGNSPGQNNKPVSNTVIEVEKEKATTVAAANEGRVSLTLTNDSENVIYIFKGAGAEIGKGIRLNKELGIVIDDYTGIVTAAAKTAKSNLCVCEI
jgi:hypothetical protein